METSTTAQVRSLWNNDRALLRTIVPNERIHAAVHRGLHSTLGRAGVEALLFEQYQFAASAPSGRRQGLSLRGASGSEEAGESNDRDLAGGVAPDCEPVQAAVTSAVEAELPELARQCIAEAAPLLRRHLGETFRYRERGAEFEGREFELAVALAESLRAAEANGALAIPAEGVSVYLVKHRLLDELCSG